MFIRLVQFVVVASSTNNLRASLGQNGHGEVSFGYKNGYYTNYGRTLLFWDFGVDVCGVRLIGRIHNVEHNQVWVCVMHRIANWYKSKYE